METSSKSQKNLLALFILFFTVKITFEQHGNDTKLPMNGLLKAQRTTSK